MTEHVLAFDLGTSGPKVGIVSQTGEVLASEFEPTRQLLLPDGGAEQDPEDWWQALTKATLRLLAREIVPRDSIVALATTAQWSGTVAVDEIGKPLMNAIIWMDSRGAPHVRRLTGGPVTVMGYAPLKALRWIRLTGGAPTHSGKDTLSHILFIRDELPEIYAKTHKFLEPKDYLNLKFTGRFTATYDSIACTWITDNRDANNIKYDDTLLRVAGVEREKFPDLCASTDVVGPLLPELCERFGLRRDVVVIGGSPDLHSAAVGAGTTRDFSSHLYVGTSSWIACHVPRKMTDIAHNMAALPAGIPGRYILLNEQETAGACLSQLRDHVFFADDALSNGHKPDDVYKLFDRVAGSAPAGSGRLIFLPWLYGERTPVEDAMLRGAFFNYSLSTERSHLVRSVLEGIAYNSRWLLTHVENFIGHELSELRFIGGGAKSDLWCQIYANVLGRPILRVRQPLLANIRGVALLAFVARGLLRVQDIESLVAIEKRFEPEVQHAGVYSELYGVFLSLHRQNKAIFSRLNQRAKP
jgi:xylulokinase